MHTRIVPSSGTRLPVIGCGTWRGFDVGSQPAQLPRRADVLTALFDSGGRVLDSSPMYGSAEQVVGDLLQVHNLVDWRTHLQTLRAWKAQGRISHIGVTHYTDSAHAELEQVLRTEPLDFLQCNYSITDRHADQRLLPLAAERGVAVLVNLPFGGGRSLQQLHLKPLPQWAAEIGCSSWNQLLLKFVLSQPAVTCVIPGTSSPDHMRDNAAAGTGELPGPEFWAGKPAELGF